MPPSHHAPPAKLTTKRNQLEEPIYEAVIPREELPVVPELPEPHSLENGHKLRPKSPAVQTIRSGSPGHPMSPSSPKHSRPNSRASSAGYGVGSNTANISSHYGFSAERAERRKYRVEKKLQEIDVTEREREALRDDVYSDLLEFAENNFNTHERTPEGTIIATLTRKGRKSVDLVPKFEMISYYRGNSIPSSHIHMYDPENISIAVNIFKVR